MILIHTALFAEAKPIIEYYKLRFIQKKPYRVYSRDNIILVCTSVGNCSYLDEVYRKYYNISKAFNIGIVGCKNRDIAIGELFCVTHRLDNIAYESITTSKVPIDNPLKISTTLVDMEFEEFYKISFKYLESKYIYSFKIVSDYLNTTILDKKFVWKIVQNRLKEIDFYITSIDFA